MQTASYCYSGRLLTETRYICSKENNNSEKVPELVWKLFWKWNSLFWNNSSEASLMNSDWGVRRLGRAIKESVRAVECMNVPNPDGITSSDPICYFDRYMPLIMIWSLVKTWYSYSYHRSVTLGCQRPCCTRTLGPNPYQSIRALIPVVHFEEHVWPAILLDSKLRPAFCGIYFDVCRDAWAGSFEFLFDELDEMRTDCPETIPAPPVTPPEAQQEYKQPLNDLQRGLIQLAASLNNDVETAIKISQLLQTEADGVCTIQSICILIGSELINF